MPGILASSASRQMSAGEAAVGGSSAGYVAGEPIALSVTPVGTSVAWSLGTPAPSAKARSALAATGIAASFTPDVPGFYVIAATVDGSTTYTLVVSVTDIVLSTLAEALRFQAKEPTAIPAPVAGALAVFDSMATKAITQKSENGVVTPIVQGVVGQLLTDADQAITVAGGVHFTLPTLTGSRAKTLGTAGASVGHVIEVHRPFGSALNTAAVVNGGPGAGTLFTFPAGELHSAKFRFDGTNWALSERRKLA